MALADDPTLFSAPAGEIAARTGCDRQSVYQARWRAQRRAAEPRRRGRPRKGDGPERHHPAVIAFDARWWRIQGDLREALREIARAQREELEALTDADIGLLADPARFEAEMRRGLAEGRDRWIRVRPLRRPEAIRRDVADSPWLSRRPRGRLGEPVSTWTIWRWLADTADPEADWQIWARWAEGWARTRDDALREAADAVAALAAECLAACAEDREAARAIHRRYAAACREIWGPRAEWPALFPLATEAGEAERLAVARAQRDAPEWRPPAGPLPDRAPEPDPGAPPWAMRRTGAWRPFPDEGLSRG